MNALSRKKAPRPARHAYLHRKEGDPSNAKYWYTRCGKKPSKDSLEEEWRSIASALLGR
jgi:hypothetical protein